MSDKAIKSPAMNTASPTDAPECKCGKSFNECMASSCEHFDLAAPVGQGSATSGEATANDLNILESCALWLDGRSRTAWAREFGHGDLMAQYARRLREIRAALAASAEQKQIPTTLHCPECAALHVDEGEWATRAHKTHQCQACKHEWRPYEYPTVGVAASAEQSNNSGSALDEYGETDFGFTFAGIQLEAGDKRLASLIVRALGTAHPAMDDLTALLFRARPALVVERAAAPASVPDGFSGDNEKLRSSIAALLALDKSGALVPHGIGGHARTLLTAAASRLAAPEVAQPAAQGESIDTPELWALIRKHVQNAAGGYDDEVLDSRAAIIGHINQWGASQRRAGQLSMDAVVIQWGEGQRKYGRREELKHQLTRIRHLEIERDSALAGARAQHETNVALVNENCTLHRQLAAEKLRADQGWSRYEEANADRNALRERLATPAPTAPLSKQEIARLIEQHTGMTERQDERAYADLARLVEAVLDAAPTAGEPSATDPRFRLQWSEPSKPNSECSYDHMTATTPFGRILITWKSWKDDPSFCVDEHPIAAFAFHVGNELDATKEASEGAFFDAIRKAIQGGKEGAG